MADRVIKQSGRRGGKRFADLLAEASRGPTRGLSAFEEARRQINSGLNLHKHQQTVVERIQGRELTFIGFDESSHIGDALLYGQSASRMHRPAEEQLAKFSNAELVMEMLKRGYAVMKCPDGQPPETLRGKD